MLRQIGLLVSLMLCGTALALQAGETKPPVAPVVPASIPETKDAKVLFQTVCAACHGQNGEGNELLKSPSIASLPSWYVMAQMTGFRESKRGANPQDTSGVLMAAIARMLKPEQVSNLAAHVETMPLVVPKVLENRADVDVNNGMLLWQERCMECHRYNASGELAFGSPPLIGRQDWYLLAQLGKFKSGHRGSVKGDENGAKMVRSVQFLESEQDMKDVVAYIMTLNTDPVMTGVSDPFDSKPVSAAK